MGCQQSLSRSSADVLALVGMEEWGFVEDLDLQGWKGACLCMTCQHFAYGIDQRCRTLVGCNVRQKQLRLVITSPSAARFGLPHGRKSMAGLQRRVDAFTVHGVISIASANSMGQHDEASSEHRLFWWHGCDRVDGFGCVFKHGRGRWMCSKR